MTAPKRSYESGILRCIGASREAKFADIFGEYQIDIGWQYSSCSAQEESITSRRPLNSSTSMQCL